MAGARRVAKVGKKFSSLIPLGGVMLILGLWLFVGQGGMATLSPSPRRALRVEEHTVRTTREKTKVPTAPHPRILYGTAWKKERTQHLVQTALEQGFLGIDTANQPKHYTEVMIGSAVARQIDAGIVTRDQLFLQTKFTHYNGQDPNNCPYDPNLPPAEQLTKSFALSLEHLQTTYVDSYVLHGPSVGGAQLGPKDWEVWGAMEEINRRGAAKYLGISNVNIDQLQELWEGAEVKPAFVQNRCYAKQGWDMTVRQFCKANGIVYQGFSLLTANPDAMGDEGIATIAKRINATAEQVVFRFAVQVGMLPLSGTTSPLHMQHDLLAAGSSDTMRLTDAEVIHIETAFMEISKEMKGDDD